MVFYNVGLVAEARLRNSLGVFANAVTKPLAEQNYFHGGVGGKKLSHRGDIPRSAKVLVSGE